jgi:hypothetical protein
MTKSRRMRRAGHVARMGRERMHTGYWWESQKERGHKEDNNIKMDLREIGWSGMDWIDLAVDRAQWRAPVSTLMNLRVP